MNEEEIDLVNTFTFKILNNFDKFHYATFQKVRKYNKQFLKYR